MPKTPEWASEKMRVPVRIIKALARQWAAKRTTVVHGFGGPYIRGPYSHEPARLEGALLAMQGLGKPGQHSFCHDQPGGVRLGGPSGLPALARGHHQQPRSERRAAYRGYSPFPLHRAPQADHPQDLVHDAILKGEFTIQGSSLQSTPAAEQFVEYKYPAEGCSPST